MKTFKYTITDPIGIHARPASQLVKELKSYTSTVYLEAGDKKGNARGIISIMGMAVQCNEEVTFVLEGPDEESEMLSLKKFCEKIL